MNSGAAVLLELDKQEELLIDDVSPASAIRIPQNDDPSTSVVIYHLVSRMQEFGDQYARSIQAAARDLMDLVCASGEAADKIKSAEDEFQLKVLEAAGQMDSQRQSLIDEIRSFDGLWHEKVIEKIIETEAALESGERNIQTLIEDHTVDLPRLMRIQTEHREKKAYLQGLKFRAEDFQP